MKKTLRILIACAFKCVMTGYTNLTNIVLKIFGSSNYYQIKEIKEKYKIQKKLYNLMQIANTCYSF